PLAAAAAVLTIDSLVEALSDRPAIARVVRDFAPPRRFADRRFDNFDPRHPTQEAAVVRLKQLTAPRANHPLSGFPAWWRRGRSNPKPGIYLDGGFGVGKTHLLAATWHATGARAAYLSFDELMYFIGIVGLDGAATALTRHR